MSERSSQTTVAMTRGTVQIPAEMSAETSSAQSAAKPVRKRYSATTAAQIMDAVRDLERIEDVITISAIARRTGVSRPTVRAVLREECGWTPAQSRRAHHAGVRRGKLLQAVTGHPGLAQGRATLESRGWPNLRRAQQASRTRAYPALQRGRETQAAHGWPSLVAGHLSFATAGYPHLAQGRVNLAARGWPNWQLAQDALKAQDYLPLVEAQRLRKSAGRAPQADPQIDTDQTDRRRARGRTTRLAILAALQAGEAQPDRPDQHASDPNQARTSTRAASCRVTAREIAARLHLHPSTVYAHLKQIRSLVAQEVRA